MNPIRSLGLAWILNFRRVDLICLLMSNSGFYIRILNSLTLNRSEARITLHGVFDTDFFTFVLRFKKIPNGFAGVTACGWFLTTNLPNPTNTYRVATYKIRQIRPISVRKKHISV